MAKTKTISPELIADISVFFSIIPILAFLIFFKRKIEKLKWVCLLLLLSNFTFDLYSIKLAKIPIASGIINYSNYSDGKHRLNLKVQKGNLYEGQFITSKKFTGTIVKLVEDKSVNSNVFFAEVEGNNTFTETAAEFKVFSNIWIINIAFLFELALIFIFFFVLFNNNSKWKRLSIYVLFIVLVWWAYRNLIDGKLHTNGGVYNGVITLFIVIFAMVYYYQQLSSTKNLFIESTPSFWFVSGILIYKTATFFLFIYSSILHQSQKENFYLINSISYILLGIFFTVAFTISNKNNTNNLSKQSR